MSKRQVSLVMVDHGGEVEITLFEAWPDAKAWFDKQVADYGVELEVEKHGQARWSAYNMGYASSYPFIEVRKQAVEPSGRQ